MHFQVGLLLLLFLLLNRVRGDNKERLRHDRPMAERGNIFGQSDPSESGERFETLLKQGNVVIERIVSSANAEPTRFVQDHDEWVVLLRGKAVLDVEGETMTLRRGDYVFLPAHTPHTVTRTSADALWLAIHMH